MRLRKKLWFSFVALSISLSVGASFLIVQAPTSLIGAKLHFDWERKESQETISMLFVGDMMMGRYIKTLIDRNGGDFPFSYMPEIIEEMEEQLDVRDIDLVVGNIEGPISDSTYVNPGTAMIFNFKPEVADQLKDAGFTTLSMANNHAFDQGREGHAQTYDYLTAAGIDAFGHPDIPDGEWSFHREDFLQSSVGFLGFHDVTFKLDQEAALAEVEKRSEEVDFLIVSIHWGVEYETTARTYMEDMAHSFVDAGADMIHGHHPHVVQNSELYQGAPIYYSLGNFVFDQYWSAATQEGLVVGLRIDGDKITTTEFMVDLVNQGEPKLREE